MYINVGEHTHPHKSIHVRAWANIHTSTCTHVKSATQASIFNKLLYAKVGFLDWL